MRLRVFTPAHVAVDAQVGRVTAEAVEGSFTMLPRHIDVVAVLVPGLLAFDPVQDTDQDLEVFVAVDGGTVVKVGSDVLVSTPAAVEADDLEELRGAVDAMIREREAHEESARLALARMEADVIQRMIEFEEREWR